jgi:hypothetical protein
MFRYRTAIQSQNEFSIVLVTFFLLLRRTKFSLLSVDISSLSILNSSDTISLFTVEGGVNGNCTSFATSFTFRFTGATVSATFVVTEASSTETS